MSAGASFARPSLHQHALLHSMTVGCGTTEQGSTPFGRGSCLSSASPSVLGPLSVSMRWALGGFPGGSAWLGCPLAVSGEA